MEQSRGGKQTDYVLASKGDSKSSKRRGEFRTIFLDSISDFPDSNFSYILWYEFRFLGFIV